MYLVITWELQGHDLRAVLGNNLGTVTGDKLRTVSGHNLGLDWCGPENCIG